MRPPRHVKVSPADIHPGDEFEGYEYDEGLCLTQIIVNEEGIPLSWGEYPLNNEPIVFLRRMGFWEEQEWYKKQIDMANSANQLNLMGIHADLYSVGDAYHEMWNGWVHADWAEQLVELVDEDFFIIGIAPAPYGCFSLDNPVAMVAEYRDSGDRFWCHAAQNWIDDMRKESKGIYKALMEGAYA